jgi:hypothetical protein
MDKIELGDLFWIYSNNGHILSCDSTGPVVFADPSTVTVNEQLLMYCGHPKKPETFYLSFKYKPGFLVVSEEGKLINGVPHYERTVFNAAEFLSVLGQPIIVKISNIKQ